MSSMKHENGAAGPVEMSPLTVDTEHVVAVSLIPERLEYPEGSVPDFRFRFKNDGKSLMRVCTYMLPYRLMFAMTAKDEEGNEFGLYPFRTGAWEKFKPEHLRTLLPGQEISESIAITKSEGWTFFRMNSQPPVLTWSHRTTGFPPGSYTFTTCLLDRMGIYAGGDGFHDRQVDLKKVPDQIVGLPKGNYVDVFRREITARAKVKILPKT